MDTIALPDPKAKVLWLLIPGKREAYCPLFEGTTAEVLEEALAHARRWNTTSTIIYAPEGRYHGGRATLAKVSPLSDKKN